MNLETAQKRLAEVEERIHCLNMGKAIEEVQKNGRKIRYTRADVPQLETYKLKLQTTVENLTAAAAGGSTARRRLIPIYLPL
jgi:prefoldin subunit 5